MAEERVQRRLAAILAADVVGYSRLMEQDESGTLASLKARRKEVLEPLVARHQGRVFKVTGDGVLIDFGSAVNAVQCAIELQQGMAAANSNLPETRRIVWRIGVNLGDVIMEGSDLYGDGINIAARLESIAEPGGIAVSGTAFDQVKNKIDVVLEDLGPQTLKNIAEAVRVYRVTGMPRVSVHAKAVIDKPSIAVLPFANMSGDPEQEYFSDGITEDIITDLSKISGLHVVARNTMFTYKNKPIKVQQAAHELEVRFVLEGSVRRAGSRVRITGQLIDGKDGSHVWAERYDRELTDIFAIQDEINHAIVDQLKVKLLPAEKKALAAAPTENVEAYTYYLRGRQFFLAASKSYLLLARRMFTKAAELDPHYARAYAGIADCDSMLHALHHADVSVEGILATSAKALALDPELAEAHASRGRALQFAGQYEEAITEFDHALALDPNLYEANFFYALFFFERGDFERAAELCERAAQLRSDDYRSPLLASTVYRSLGRDADRERSARLGLERAEREFNLHPENSSSAQYGALALAHLGECDRAKEWAARALAIDPDDMNTQYNIACVHSQLGQPDQAIELLEKVLPYLDAVAARRAWVQHDSDLDPIRNNPRFQKLIETIGMRRGPIS
jgi:adenylate cyclase